MNAPLKDAAIFAPRTTNDHSTNNTFTPVVAIMPVAPRTIVNRSGTINVAGAAQVLANANPERMGYWIQNQSDTDLYINTEDTAHDDNGSLRLAPGAMYEPPYGGMSCAAISIFGANLHQAFAAREW